MTKLIIENLDKFKSKYITLIVNINDVVGTYIFEDEPIRNRLILINQ